MSKQTLKQIEAELSKDPKFARFFQAKNQHDEALKAHKESNTLIGKFFDKLGSKIKMLFDKAKVEEDERFTKTEAARTALLAELNLFRKKFEGKDDKSILKAIDKLRDDLNKKELSVNIEAPIVNVPDPKVILETKHAEKTNELLALLIKHLAKQTNDKVFIKNESPNEAIPVVLTDDARKAFYNAVLQAVSSGGPGKVGLRIGNEDVSATNPLPVFYRQEYAARWTSDTDFNKGTKLNTAVVGTGDDAYVGLSNLDNNSDNVPFTDPANYDYDTDEIEVTGGKAKLKLSTGASKDWPFDDEDDYTFDTAKIDVSGGEAKLVGFAGIYAHYHLNELSGTDIADSSGNGRDGTTVNGPSWVAAKLNNGLELTTTSQYGNLGDIASFERTDPFSVELWIKSTQAGTMIARRDGGGSYRGWDVMYSAGKVYFYFANTTISNMISVYANYTLADDTWHHLVVTYDGSSNANGVNIYIDGDLKSKIIQYNTLSATTITTTYCQLGARGGGNVMKGVYDEVLIYDREITADEVTERYNSGTGTEKGGYDTTDPKITTDTGMAFSSELSEFTETATKPSNTELKYQVSFNDGSTWKWWNGSAWITITGGQTDAWYYANEANLASEIDTNIGSLASSGTFKFRAFLHTTNPGATPELEDIYVSTNLVYPIGSFEISMKTDIQPTLNYGYISTTETVTKPANTDIKYQYSTDSGSTYNGTWLTEAELEVALQTIPCLGDGSDKVRFKFQLTTSVNYSTPEIDNLNIVSSQGYNTSGYFESNVFNSNYLSMDWGDIIFDIVSASGGTLVFKCRSGNSSPITSEYGTALTNNEDSNVTGKYFQWKVEFTGDGETTPKVNSFLVKYYNPELVIQAV